jgi:AhpC/TSA family
MTHPLAAAQTPPATKTFPTRDLATISGQVRIPDPSRLVHLQLRRYAGCPICSLHLRSFARRHAEISEAGIVEVAVFHSSSEDLATVHATLPFALVPDPKRSLYEELGVGTSKSAMTNPSVWLAAVRALGMGAGTHATIGAADGSFGLPGDFLIEPGGCIVASYRGLHADDHWSVDELLEIVRLYRGSK